MKPKKLVLIIFSPLVRSSVAADEVLQPLEAFLGPNSVVSRTNCRRNRLPVYFYRMIHLPVSKHSTR